MNGKLHQKILLRIFPISLSGIIVESIFLFFIGLLPIVFHFRSGYNLGIPGHHGMEYMAMIMVGRTVTRSRWASVMMTLGIITALFIPYVGIKNPVTAIVFIMPPFIVDLFYNYIKNWKNNILLLALTGGIAYTILPVYKTIIHFTTGIPYKPILLNPVYPFITHFVFGFAGALLGAGIVLTIKKNRRSRNKT